MFSAIPVVTAAEAFELGVLLFFEAGAIVLVAHILLRLGARRSASLRATVATAATLGLLLLPLASNVAPAWVLPGSDRVPSSWMEAPTRGLLAVSVQDGRSPALAATEEAGSTAGEAAASGQATDSASEAWFAPQNSSRATSPPLPSPSGWPSTLLVGLWLLGVGYGVLRIVLEELALAVAVRHAALPSAHLRHLLVGLGVGPMQGRAPRVRLVEGLASPAVTGMWRPVLLLPPEAEEWKREQLESVLRHEAGHVARGDVLDHHLGRLVEVLYWPNPLVSHLVRRARAERERACDDYALRHGVAPDQYAAALLDLAHSAGSGRRLSGAVGMAVRSSSNLKDRVLSVLDGVRDRRPTSRPTRLVVMSVFVALSVPLAGARAVAEESVIPGAIVRGLAHTDPLARRAAVAQLGDVCTPEVTRHAMELLHDPDGSVRVSAAGAIASYGEPEGVAALVLAIERETEPEIANRMVHEVATAYSTHAESALIRLVEHLRAEIRALALEGFDRRRTLGYRGLRALSERLETEVVPELRAAALRAIGWRGLGRVPDALHRAANDESRVVRAAALELASARARDWLARDALECLAQDRDPALRDRARAAIEG